MIPITRRGLLKGASALVVSVAAALLRDKPRPTDGDIRTALAGLKCRCGTHMAILRAVKRAAGTTA